MATLEAMPKSAWGFVWRWTGIVTLLSMGGSLALTDWIMTQFSAGLNTPGIASALIMPVALGGPMVFYLLLKHQQLAFANAQLKILATTDSMTQCLNRRAFTYEVSALLDQPDATTTTGTFLLIDADNFKQINDRFGHAMGDQALSMIATAIRTTVRADDLVGRVGGEEFGVFLIGADYDTANDVAERIRYAVAGLTFHTDENTHPLSVSIGGAVSSTSATFAALYRLADQKLYVAKQSGRDMVQLIQQAA